MAQQGEHGFGFDGVAHALPPNGNGAGGGAFEREMMFPAVTANGLDEGTVGLLVGDPDAPVVGLAVQRYFDQGIELFADLHLERGRSEALAGHQVIVDSQITRPGQTGVGDGIIGMLVKVAVGQA